MIARQLLKNNEADLYPVAFADDDPNKYKLQIYGIDVKGNDCRYSFDCRKEQGGKHRDCDSVFNEERNAKDL